MYTLIYTNRMKRDVKLIKKRGKDIKKLAEVIDILLKGESLPDKNKDHQLQGEWQGFRECHIEPDWLFIYRIEEQELILFATATGSHSDLFGK
ncbi:MAG: type II toxin-antitoxin system YafQ family toxin [Candidatus Gastranaerophilales bacterium]|nr:type II toxin-antitoxin system YafQ family toxin [Candidatus Gastranaerophilales bacterium]